MQQKIKNTQRYSTNQTFRNVTADTLQSRRFVEPNADRRM